MGAHNPTRAELWMAVAAAVLSRPRDSERDEVADAVQTADRMMAAFDKRFTWATGGSGNYWRWERDA